LTKLWHELSPLATTQKYDLQKALAKQGFRLMQENVAV
jgi:hypothetical protein